MNYNNKRNERRTGINMMIAGFALLLLGMSCRAFFGSLTDFELILVTFKSLFFIIVGCYMHDRC